MADGHRANYSTHHADIHVGFLNLSLPDGFSGVKMVRNALAAGALTRTPLGEFTALYGTPSGLKGGMGRDKGRNSMGREKERRKEGTSWRRSIVVRTLISAGELSLSCARLLAGRVTTLWLSRPLSVSQYGQLGHPSLRGR